MSRFAKKATSQGNSTLLSLGALAVPPQGLETSIYSLKFVVVRKIADFPPFGRF